MESWCLANNLQYDQLRSKGLGSRNHDRNQKDSLFKEDTSDLTVNLQFSNPKSPMPSPTMNLSKNNLFAFSNESQIAQYFCDKSEEDQHLGELTGQISQNQFARDQPKPLSSQNTKSSFLNVPDVNAGEPLQRSSTLYSKQSSSMMKSHDSDDSFTSINTDILNIIHNDNSNVTCEEIKPPLRLSGEGNVPLTDENPWEQSQTLGDEGIHFQTINNPPFMRSLTSQTLYKNRKTRGSFNCQEEESLKTEEDHTDNEGESPGPRGLSTGTANKDQYKINVLKVDDDQTLMEPSDKLSLSLKSNKSSSTPFQQSPIKTPHSIFSSQVPLSQHYSFSPSQQAPVDFLQPNHGYPNYNINGQSPPSWGKTSPLSVKSSNQAAEDQQLKHSQAMPQSPISVQFKHQLQRTMTQKQYMQNPLQPLEQQKYYQQQLRLQQHQHQQNFLQTPQQFDQSLKHFNYGPSYQIHQSPSKYFYNRQFPDTIEKSSLGSQYSSGSSIASATSNPHRSVGQVHQMPKYKQIKSEQEMKQFLIANALVLSKNQTGCRKLQRKIEEEQEKNNSQFCGDLLDMLMSNISELMMDSFANYLCQKLIQQAKEPQIDCIIKNIQKEFVNISLNKHGTRALQNLLKQISPLSNERSALISQALGDSVRKMSLNIHGNHVVQICLDILTQEEHKLQIYEAVINSCALISSDKHGCCVLQKSLNSTSFARQEELVDQILTHVDKLVNDSYGNYVVQQVLKFQKSETNQAILKFLCDDILYYCTQKISSNVVECAVQNSCQQSQCQVFRVFLQDQKTFKAIILDQYGNYVIQAVIVKAKDHINGKYFDQLYGLFEQSIDSLKKASFGNKFIQKVYQLSNNQETSVSLQAQEGSKKKTSKSSNQDTQSSPY